ncbi:hypothetical protein B0H14DRAFT_3515409 [Mycena olivaceomarginata]|nr:hypothetical protein B0H14DRAFT_3515409 [Mycena olivaceomarginata]
MRLPPSFACRGIFGNGDRGQGSRRKLVVAINQTHILLVLLCIRAFIGYTGLMAKRKALHVEEDDLNDGSDSDDSQEGYLPRARGQHVHYIAAETITIGSRGVAVDHVVCPTPASPAKKSRITLKPDVPAAPALSLDDWEADYAEFDAEFGPGMQSTGPRKLRGIGECPLAFPIDDPHGQWLRLDREDFLDEMLRHDGHGDYIDQTVCAGSGCEATQILYAAPTACTVVCGSSWDIEWASRFCPNPSKSAGDDFVVITTQGIEEVGLDYCDCGTAKANLVRETDNTGLEPSRGVPEDDAADHINATKPGEVALLCPACPHPGINLPPDWDKVPVHLRFLYALFLAIDTNFRLMRKDVSSEEKDPGLVRGWGFFGEVAKYMAHLEKHWDQKQDKYLRLARRSRQASSGVVGTASSGIGTVDCARHNMKRPNGVGDLQMGERYLNMDYLFFMSLAGCLLLQLFVSYDIACQWYKNLWERMRIFDPHVQLKEGEKIVGFLVPKFHLPAHIENCNLLFSFNLTPFHKRIRPGREAGHAGGPLPVLELEKIMRLGSTLRDRLQKNLPLMVESKQAWVDVEASFSTSVIETWTTMAHLPQVRLRMAEIAAKDVDHLRVRGEMHETEMLSMGLQLEESHTRRQRRGVPRMERETKLRRKIDGWISVQQLFIPETALLRQREAAEQDRVGATQSLPGVRAQDITLWLPSAISTLAEFQALNDLRSRLISRMREYKHRGKVSGVRAKTRSGTRVANIQAEVDRAANEYRTARAALVALGPRLQRKDHAHLRVLNAADVRGRPSAVFGDDDRRKKGGKRKKKARRMGAVDPEAAAEEAEVDGATGEDKDLVDNEALRIEWARVRAKAMCYAEGNGPAGGGNAPRAAVLPQDQTLQEGHASYALKQAAYQDGMHARAACAEVKVDEEEEESEEEGDEPTDLSD